MVDDSCLAEYELSRMYPYVSGDPFLTPKVEYLCWGILSEHAQSHYVDDYADVEFEIYKEEG